MIIPSRNDSEELAALLEALKLSLRAEILIINDHSNKAHTQRLKQLAEQYPVRLIENAGKGKKAALAAGITQAKAEIIVQLDADVVPAEYFIQTITAPFRNDQTKMILGLVKMEPRENFWSKLAALDFLSLQFSGHALAQSGKAIMGNGAALAYRKEVYYRYHSSGKTLSSGDDVFLIQALAQKEPDSIKTMTNAYVTSSAPANLREFIQQRVRWGGKTMAYPSLFARGVAFLIAGVNWLTIVLFVFSFMAKPVYISFLMFFALKLVIEYIVLANFARRTDQVKITKHFYLAIIYPFYIVLTTILILFGKSKVNWKGRAVKT